MNIEMDRVNLTLRADSTDVSVHVYEAAIQYFINQLPIEKRPQKNEIIDVSKWVSGRVQLKPN
jgi:hypothetical protein